MIVKMSRLMPELPLSTMAWITGAILAVYLGGIAYAIFSPAKQPDPQRGMAVGCLSLATIPAFVVGIVVVIGVVWDIPRLVRWPFNVCAIVFGYVVILLLAQAIVRAWRRRQ
jgi:hypothetical protein